MAPSLSLRHPQCLAGALLLFCACSGRDRTPPPLSGEASAALVRAIADSALAAIFSRYPESKTYIGIAGATHDGLHDNSIATMRRHEAEDDRWLAELAPVVGDSLLGRPEWALYGSLKEMFEAGVQNRVCRDELWAVDQMGGWQTTLPYLASIQPVGSDSLRGQALVRWRQVPRYVDVEIESLREGLRLGYSAPKGTVRLVIGQLDRLLAPPPDSSEFYSPAARDSSPAFAAAFRALVADSINPALARYRDFLRDTYLPAARETFAISALPNGAACYRASVRAWSTVDISPDSLYNLGLAQMALIEREMQVIAERSFGTSDVPGLLRQFKTDPRYMFTTRAEIMAYSRDAVDRAWAVMPQWFGVLPKAKVTIEPVPSFRETSAVGEYASAAEDGSRPGTFFISTYHPEQRSRAGPQAVAFHETIPGHHLQITIAREQQGENHQLMRYLGNSGFSEGWGLYAERLADEMGLYSSDLDRMGMLSEQAWRAARLVIDPGLHTKGWTREQAIDYLASHTTVIQGEAASEIDRYITWPGQATSYMLGMLEIRRLRTQAESTLGPRFDIRAFHDQVLQDGAVPLPLLQTRINRWVAAERSREPSP